MLALNTPVLTTLQFPCVAQHYYTINCVHEIESIIPCLVKTHKAFKIIGGGSNILCAATQIEAVLSIHIKGIQLKSIEEDSWIIQVGAGENWHDTVIYTLQQGWLGLENLAFIPGLVGAAPVQNIGAYGLELSNRLHSVQVWDIQCNRAIDMPLSKCAFGYRSSLFKHTDRYIITHITLKLPRNWQAVVHYGELAQHNGTVFSSNQEQAIAIANLVINIRKQKLPDPKLIPNAGSFFKNPTVSQAQLYDLNTQYPQLPYYLNTHNHHYKLAAAWLIQAAGWKGYACTTQSGGRIGVHHAQALVLVHFGNALGSELLELANAIQNSVFNQFGITLEREVNVW